MKKFSEGTRLTKPKEVYVLQMCGCEGSNLRGIFYDEEPAREAWYECLNEEIKTRERMVAEYNSDCDKKELKKFKKATPENPPDSIQDKPILLRMEVIKEKGHRMCNKCYKAFPKEEVSDWCKGCTGIEKKRVEKFRRSRHL